MQKDTDEHNRRVEAAGLSEAKAGEIATAATERHTKEMLQRPWRKLEDVSKWLTTNSTFQVPLFYRLLMLICVLPYSTATYERNLSALKIVKTRLRSALGDDHLDNRLALYIDMDLLRECLGDPVMLERVVTRFKVTGPNKQRRNIL